MNLNELESLIEKAASLNMQGEFEEAEDVYSEIEKLPLKDIGKTPEGIQLIRRAYFNKAWTVMRNGDYKGSLELADNGRYIGVYGSPPLNTRAPLYNPNEHDLSGKTVMLNLEGGLGDQISQVRFAKVLKNKGVQHLLIRCSKQLAPVFKRIKYIDRIVFNHEEHEYTHLDHWIPGFSAGNLLDVDFTNIQNTRYLTPDNESVKEWRKFLSTDKIKVGIRWAGSPTFEHEQHRKFPPSFLTELSKYEQLQIFSLQRDDNLLQLPSNIVDLESYLMTWDDTMSVIENMDLIITSCTSVAHMACAMGKETWVVVPILPYHTWAPGAPTSNTTPFYKSAKIYRQTEVNVWKDVFQKLYNDLEDKYDLKHEEHSMSDKTYTRLNLGCGLKKIPGFVNVDQHQILEPDEVVNLAVHPLKWEDDSVSEINAHHFFEFYDGDMTDLLKEMYRISAHNATWEVIAYHWNKNDVKGWPDFKNVIAPITFAAFDRASLKQELNISESVHGSLSSVIHNMDLEITDIKYEYSPEWAQKLHKKEVSEQEIHSSMSHLNDVVIRVYYKITVHKPGRVTTKELLSIMDKI